MTLTEKGLVYFASVLLVLCALSATLLAADPSPAAATTLNHNPETGIALMQTLAEAEKSRELVDRFKDQDFAGWARAGDAFYWRGLAYLALKDVAHAEQDLEASVKCAPKEAYFWYNLGKVYRLQGRSTAKVVSAYKKAAELENKRGWMPADATLTAAGILMREVKTDEALEILNLYNNEDLDQLSSSWQVRILRARGQVLAAAGAEREAMAAFGKALTIERSQ